MNPYRPHTAITRRRLVSTTAAGVAVPKSYLGLGFVPSYRTDTDRADDHEARWSAIFATLLAPRTT